VRVRSSQSAESALCARTTRSAWHHPYGRSTSYRTHGFPLPFIQCRHAGVVTCCRLRIQHRGRRSRNHPGVALIPRSCLVSSAESLAFHEYVWPRRPSRTRCICSSHGMPGTRTRRGQRRCASNASIRCARHISVCRKCNAIVPEAVTHSATTQLLFSDLTKVLRWHLSFTSATPCNSLQNPHHAQPGAQMCCGAQLSLTGRWC